MSAVFNRWDREVRIFFCTNQFITLADFACYVRAVFLTANFCTNPSVLRSLQRRWSI
jgi:hypothetical protein